eukprot:XP_001705003.1 Hypothetical protein GL50803_9338 [Giardia lamblia ATCC 50803]
MVLAVYVRAFYAPLDGLYSIVGDRDGALETDNYSLVATFRTRRG